MAQIQAKRVRDGATRKDAKIALIRLLYERGYSREQIVWLFNIIDWMLQLPKALEPEFVQAVNAIQEEKHMPYVNTIERLGIEKGEKLGIEKGRQEGRQEERQEAERRALESKRNAARKLIALTEMNDQLIAEIEELPVKEVEKLRAETRH
ncbi:hypothetical protein LG277_03430 [Vreelandella aquamarina]|uniref:hypothetical protein n=1 Tax=Vreelandella aquamarina TaxID=77097 RepID=UPI00384E1903